MHLRVAHAPHLVICARRPQPVADLTKLSQLAMAKQQQHGPKRVRCKRHRSLRQDWLRGRLAGTAG